MRGRLLDRLQADYPTLHFRKGKKFAFRPPRTIIIGPDESCDSLLLLHEVGHALLGHREFNMDIERLKMEREAWEKAKELCMKYDLKYDREIAERELDTYREWLDQKSRCPYCGLTRFQTPDRQYHCPRCDTFRQLS